MYLKYKNGVEIYEASNLYSKVIRQLSNDTKWKLDDGATVYDMLHNNRMIEVIESTKYDGPRWLPKEQTIDIINDFIIVRRSDLEKLNKKELKAVHMALKKVALSNFAAGTLLTAEEVLEKFMLLANTVRKNIDEEEAKQKAYKLGYAEGKEHARKQFEAIISSIVSKF